MVSFAGGGAAGVVVLAGGGGAGVVVLAGGGGGLAFEAPGVKVVASAQNAMRRLTYRIIFTMTHSGNKAQIRTLSTSH